MYKNSKHKSIQKIIYILKSKCTKSENKRLQILDNFKVSLYEFRVLSVVLIYDAVNHDFFVSLISWREWYINFLLWSILNSLFGVSWIPVILLILSIIGSWNNLFVQSYNNIVFWIKWGKNCNPLYKPAVQDFVLETKFACPVILQICSPHSRHLLQQNSGVLPSVFQEPDSIESPLPESCA